MEYVVWKWLHVLSSTLLFGAGLGTAFFLFFANRTGEVRAIAVVTRYVVIADTLFTLPTVIFQPLSGYMLMQLAGTPLLTEWIWISFALYFVAGLCWLPVVWLQLQMRDIATETAMSGAPMLPARYWRYERIWAVLGIPAVTALVIVFYLMIAKPT